MRYIYKLTDMKQLLLILLFVIGAAYPQRYASYQYVALVLNVYDVEYNRAKSGEYLTSDVYNKSFDGLSPIHIDTSYYIIDLECFLNTPNWTDTTLQSFYDYVETDTIPHSRTFTQTVNSFTNGLEYVWFGGPPDAVIQYLATRKLKKYRG